MSKNKEAFMKLSGKIDKLHSFVASDPSYGEGVWCRYEVHPNSDKPWKAELLLKNIDEKVHDDEDNFDYDVQGVDFSLYLYEASNKQFKLHEDGGFTRYKSSVLKEYQIGADTACIAIGANDMADEIKGCKEEWQPACSLRTLTDGLIGVVTEGRDNGNLSFILLNGFLDKDTGYTIESLKDYFIHQLDMKEVVIEKDTSINKTIKVAKEKSEASPVKTDVEGLDDMEK